MTEPTTEIPERLTVRRPRLPAVVGWLLVLALVVAICVVGLAGVRQWQARSGDELGQAPVTLAEEVAADFFTLDHRTLDDDIDQLLARTGGSFAEHYREQSAELRQAVTREKLVLTAEVPESGAAVEHYDGDEAWVLVAVDVHVESASAPPTDTRYRTRVVLERDDGTWLVTRLEQVG